jgi:hypothetical protein
MEKGVSMFRKLMFLLVTSYSVAEMAVYDIGSYAYYIEQIEQATELLQKMQQEVETLGGIKTATDDVKRQIYHVQDAFRNAINSYIAASESLANAINNTPDTVDKLFSTDRDSITTSPTQGGVYYQDTTALLDDLYKTTPATAFAARFLNIEDEQMRRSIQKDVTNLAWRRVFADKDLFQKRQDDRVKRVGDLLKKVETSEADGDPVSISQMQINTALLLAELVQTQTELLELQKSQAVAQSLEKYKEVKFNETKRKLEILNDEDPNRRENYYKSKTPQWQGRRSNFNFDEKMGF